MNLYKLHALFEDYKFVERDIKASDLKAAKKKFRNKFKGKVTSIQVISVAEVK